MVKNTKGGSKTKQTSRKVTQTNINYSDLIKTDDQEYAKITKVNGGGRYEVLCTDKTERLGISRGKINRCGKVTIGTLVLISKRDYQDSKCDIIHIYRTEERNYLIKQGEVSSSFIGELSSLDSENEENVEFTAFEEL